MPNERTHSPAQKRVLIVDDEAGVRNVLEEILSLAGYATATAADGNEAISRFDEQRPDIVLLDLLMPGMLGSEVARLILQRSPQTPIVIITGSADDVVASYLSGIQVSRVIKKPFTIAQILGTARELIGSA